MFDLRGKTAIVTGGGSGIGRAISTLFCKQGARVTVLDVDENAVEDTVHRISDAGGDAAALRCDVTDPARVEAAFESAESERGPLDILVNNAGVAHVGTIESTSLADFERVCRINITGAFLCAQAAVRRMVRRKRGVILNMASITALVGVPDRFAYSVTKGAILTMTYSIAVDYVTQGIRCNCLCPARVHTPFVDGFVNRNYPGQEAETYRKLNEYQPIGRMGRPDEVAALALYLCSDEAEFVTGAAYPIDGGVTGMR